MYILKNKLYTQYIYNKLSNFVIHAANILTCNIVLYFLFFLQLYFIPLFCMKQENFESVRSKLIIIMEKLDDILNGILVNKTGVTEDAEDLIQAIQSISIDVNELDDDY